MKLKRETEKYVERDKVPRIPGLGITHWICKECETKNTEKGHCSGGLFQCRKCGAIARISISGFANLESKEEKNNADQKGK